MSVPVARSLRAHPPCFESKEQWQQWHLADETATHGKTQYCADCTPKYQMQMIDEDRCLHPQVKFYRINGGMTGCMSEPSEHDGVIGETNEEIADKAVNGEAGS